MLVREAKADEIPFVVHSWSRSYGDRKHWGPVCRRQHRAVIRRLLARPTTRIYVADVDGVVLGYVVVDPTYQEGHYMYVKSPFRKKYGVYEALMDKVREEVPDGIKYRTHDTHKWAKTHEEGEYRSGLLSAECEAAMREGPSEASLRKSREGSRRVVIVDARRGVRPKERTAPRAASEPTDGRGV